MIQAGDRRGFKDFSFFKGLIIFILNQLGTADTVYVLTRRGARAEGLLRAPDQQSGSDHHNSCRGCCNGDGLSLLGKEVRISWSCPAGDEMVSYETGSSR